ncbi:MAG: TIGR01777 family oxidoreductase [Bacteroidetes bacterium]|nr:TIGR01777 family oxidoreductase [Bacteroidota bacterium]
MNTRLKIVIAGGTGFLGQILDRELRDNYEIIILSTHKNKCDNGKIVYWDGMSSIGLETIMDGAYALINLSGKSVDCRYNEKNKREIFASRLNSTKALGNALGKCQNPPAVWINSASATIYRHAEDIPMKESDGEPGEGFSVEVCKQWEAMFFSFSHLGIRQVALRTAIVLGKRGGVMLPFRNLARFGLGGKMGKGTQMFSWIHEKDFAKSVKFILENNNITGIINIAAPNPIPNAEFMKYLRREMGVNIGIPLPKALLEIGAVLIQTETELILKSRWVLPDKLLNSGFDFQFPNIQKALKELLNVSYVHYAQPPLKSL